MTRPPDPDPFSPSLFSGELTDDELRAALERAAHDPEASRELDFLADLTATLDDPAWRERDGTRSALPFALVAALSLVAASLLFFLVSHLLETHEPAPTPAVELADLRLPVYVPTELRASTPPLVRDFTTAMEPYARGELDAAQASLTAFLLAHPEHGPGHFYLGATHLAQERLGPAAEELEQALRLSSGLLADHARWLRIQVALRAGDAATARAGLDVLAAGDGAFALRAAELRQDLARGR